MVAREGCLSRKRQGNHNSEINEITLEQHSSIAAITISKASACQMPPRNRGGALLSHRQTRSLSPHRKKNQSSMQAFEDSLRIIPCPEGGDEWRALLISPSVTLDLRMTGLDLSPNVVCVRLTGGQFPVRHLRDAEGSELSGSGGQKSRLHLSTIQAEIS